MGVNYTQNGRLCRNLHRLPGVCPGEKENGLVNELTSPEFFGESGTPKPDSR
jgi:hypothetical protein